MKHNSSYKGTNSTESPPSRRRGLKPLGINGNEKAVIQSPPSRRRGLKLSTSVSFTGGNLVASLAEAWIETSSGLVRLEAHLGRLPRGGVD